MTSSIQSAVTTGDQRAPTPLEILVSARCKIASPENWGQGRRGPGADRPLRTCCAAEAIEDVTVAYQQRALAIAFLKQASGVEQKHGSIVEWNDAPMRTHEEVLAAFDKAIELARGAA